MARSLAVSNFMKRQISDVSQHFDDVTSGIKCKGNILKFGVEQR